MNQISDAAGRPAYSELLLFKMLLVGIWNGGLSDELVEAWRTQICMWCGFWDCRWKMMYRIILCYRGLERGWYQGRSVGRVIRGNQSLIQAYSITVKQGCHVDASITQSSCKPKTKPVYEVVDDREERDNGVNAAISHAGDWSNVIRCRYWSTLS